MILAGDVGGTTTTLALYARASTPAGFDREAIASATYASREFEKFEAILIDFYERYVAPERRSIASGAIGVAGPVANGRVATTNLPWTLEAAALGALVGLDSLALLNDLEALGHAVDLFGPEEWFELQRGLPAPSGNRAVLAAGTGLGEAGLVWQERRWVPFATEGGHADFAPKNDLEIGLLRFLQREHDRVSWERVVSGPGLVAIYRFLLAEEATGVADRVPYEDPSASPLAAADPAEAIAREAERGAATVPGRALELFFRLYGAEAGNLALKWMASGGLYLAGGIAQKNLAALARGGFLETFLAKGRMRPLLEAIPVRVLLEPRAGLVGAARFAAASSSGAAR